MVPQPSKIVKPPGVYSVLEEKKIKESEYIPGFKTQTDYISHLLDKGVKPKKEPKIIKTLPSYVSPRGEISPPNLPRLP